MEEFPSFILNRTTNFANEIILHRFFDERVRSSFTHFNSNFRFVFPDQIIKNPVKTVPVAQRNRRRRLSRDSTTKV